LDRDASELFFGYIVASYSLGQILGSPVVGYLSNRFRKIRQLLYAGLFLLFAGNALYLAVHLFAIDARKYLLLTARFITGIGSSKFTHIHRYITITFLFILLKVISAF
jgi:ceroid-lipofuscinosis MFS transporter 7